jgi:hypothetical protein
LPDLLARQKLSFTEFFLLLFVGGLSLVVLTYSDIVNHDMYVLPIISECYAENQSNFCLDIRELHGLPSDAHITLGQAYWNLLQLQALGIGVLLFVLRVGFGFLAVGTKNAKKDELLILKGFIWGGTFSLLFLFGWLDFGYYIMQHEPIPEQLPWLDQSGVFVWLKMFGADPLTVDRGDLYLAMIIGAVLILIPWILLIYKWNQLRSIGRQIGV